MASSDIRFVLRVPEKIWKVLEECKKLGQGSINRLIVGSLEELYGTGPEPVRNRSRGEAETVPAPATGPEVAGNPTLPSDCHPPSRPKKMRMEDFLKLSNSEKLRAQREGKAPERG